MACETQQERESMRLIFSFREPNTPVLLISTTMRKYSDLVLVLMMGFIFSACCWTHFSFLYTATFRAHVSPWQLCNEMFCPVWKRLCVCDGKNVYLRRGGHILTLTTNTWHFPYCVTCTVDIIERHWGCFVRMAHVSLKVYKLIMHKKIIQLLIMYYLFLCVCLFIY